MSDSELNAKLKALFEATEAAVDAAQKKKFPGEAINWGDLGCVDARYYESVHGERGYQVLIEEASPGCSEFSEFIREQLKQAGWVDVEVNTEW